MLEKPIYFNVFANETSNPKAPTFKKNSVKIEQDIVIRKGTYDFAFFGNAINKEGKPNPYFKIDNPWKPKGQNTNQSLDNQGRNDDTPF